MNNLLRAPDDGTASAPLPGASQATPPISTTTAVPTSSTINVDPAPAISSPVASPVADFDSVRDGLASLTARVAALEEAKTAPVVSEIEPVEPRLVRLEHVAGAIFDREFAEYDRDIAAEAAKPENKTV